MPIHLSHEAVLGGLAALGFFWAFWYKWRFTIWPMLHPNEVKELPYYVPYLGHAYSFLTNLGGLFEYGKRTFSSAQTYLLTVAGEKMYIMSHPPNVHQVLNRLSRDEHDHDKNYHLLMRRFGISEAAITMLSQKPTVSFVQANPNLEPNPQLKTMGDMAHILVRKQLNPGPAYDAFEAVFLDNIDKAMSFDELPPEALLSSLENTKTASLLELVRWTFGRATVDAFFGPALLRVAPDFVHNYNTFDDNIWTFLYKLPTLGGNGNKSIKKLRTAVVAYLGLPEAERDGASWMVKTVITEMTARGMGVHDIAGWLIIIHWGMTSNPWRLVAWMAVHLAHDASLREAVREELAPILAIPGLTNVQLQATVSTEAKHLVSLYNESLRFYNDAISVRELTRDVQSATGETLRKGNMVMLIHRHLLMDEQVWGPDAKTFQPARFLGKEGEALLRNKNFTPYGGGPALCPGRFMSKSGALMFAAWLVSRFNLEIAQGKNKNGKGMPRVDLQTKNGTGVGIMGVKDGDDCVVVLSKRG
ncbi:cytochrome P450 [Triangularia verruculosa]|uniref:Cytochrome P450 n=1 Tax=Triangularia verruculosa TaxID=2587418 RepID=A0AAN7AUC1_9PEZI|nr:cytochrome P450 [Triangularia verruculosa]